MNAQQSSKKDIYYTKDHEWIDFQETVAYIGICSFKLIGFKQIQEIRFKDPSGLKKQGEVIASVKYNDYLVEIHMPVDGKLLEINEKLAAGNSNILLDHAESIAWIALIIPSSPHDRENLLLPEQYQLIGKSKFSKQ